MKPASTFSFRGFYAGSVAAAVLLLYGIQLIVATARDPLTALAIGAVNLVVRAGRFDVLLLAPYHFSWAIAAYTGISGLTVLFVGIRLAAWVHRQTVKELSRRL